MQHKTEEATTSSWTPVQWRGEHRMLLQTKQGILNDPLRLLKEGKQVSQKAFPVLLKRVLLYSRYKLKNWGRKTPPYIQFLFGGTLQKSHMQKLKISGVERKFSA